jgi:hypothetical protein
MSARFLYLTEKKARGVVFPLNKNLKLARKSKISCIVFDLTCAHINEHGVLMIMEVVVPEKE